MPSIEKINMATLGCDTTLLSKRNLREVVSSREGSRNRVMVDIRDMEIVVVEIVGPIVRRAGDEK